MGRWSEPTVVGEFTLELDANPTRDNGRADQILYVAFGLGWLEIEVRGEDLCVIACHRHAPHDGSEMFKMNAETGKIEPWADYGPDEMYERPKWTPKRGWE